MGSMFGQKATPCTPLRVASTPILAARHPYPNQFQPRALHPPHSLSPNRPPLRLRSMAIEREEKWRDRQLLLCDASEADKLLGHVSCTVASLEGNALFYQSCSDCTCRLDYTQLRFS